MLKIKLNVYNELQKKMENFVVTDFSCKLNI